MLIRQYNMAWVYNLLLRIHGDVESDPARLAAHEGFPRLYCQKPVGSSAGFSKSRPCVLHVRTVLEGCREIQLDEPARSW